MKTESKTLYIPLYGKAFVSKKGIILSDKKAEEIWEKEKFPLGGKSKSKWLAYFMGMRSAVIDSWVSEKLSEKPESTVLHIGCGLDSRIERVKAPFEKWFDVDFPEVINQRRKYYEETALYKMISGDLRETDWQEQLPEGDVIVILEGISMYLRPDELKAAVENLYTRFENAHILMDCYTEFAARASKYKNPINDVGVTEVFGMDDPNVLPGFIREHEMTPQDLIDQLQGMEKRIFASVFAGGVAKKMYRLYEYRMKKESK